MTPAELHNTLNELMALSAKSERVEFKEVKTKFHIPAALRGMQTVRQRH